jgi:hypothetical protein
MKEGSLEERVARIEGILEQMDKRLNHIESELRDLRRDLNNRFLLDLRRTDYNVGHDNISDTD